MISVIGVTVPWSEMFVNASYLSQRKYRQRTVFFSRGFTLIEILLVVIVLGALVAVSVPNLQASFKTLLLNDSAQDMATLMRYAQSRAIIKKERIEFIYDSAARSYALFKLDGEQDVDGEKSVLARLPGRRGRDYKIPSELDCDSTQERITFTPDGRMSFGRFSLCLGDRCMTVSTQDQKGRVLLMKGTMQ